MIKTLKSNIGILLRKIFIASPRTTVIGIGLIVFGATKFELDSVQASAIIATGTGLILSKDI